jgi:hypothetical protein
VLAAIGSVPVLVPVASRLGFSIALPPQSPILPPMRSTLILLTALLITGALGCRTAALLQPPPVSFAPLPADKVEAAIYQGCSVRHWMPSKVRDGLIQATIYQRNHVAVVDITYDSDSFQVTYVRSENLRYKNVDGQQRIHEGYNKWVKNLVGDIEVALQQERRPETSR